MNFTERNTKFGLGSEYVDWYRDAASLFWMASHHEQTIDFVTLQIVHFFLKFSCQGMIGALEELARWTQTNFTFQLFQLFPAYAEVYSLRLFPKVVIWFPGKWKKNLLRGKLQSIKMQDLAKFQKKCGCRLYLDTIEERWSVPALEKLLQLLKIRTTNLNNLFLKKVQFVSVRGSVCYNRLTTQSFTKKEPPKYELQQNSIGRNDSPSGEL